MFSFCKFTLAKVQIILLKRVTPPLKNVKKKENSFGRKDFDDGFWFIGIKQISIIQLSQVVGVKELKELWS